MAIARTILPRKGLVQSQHGVTQYEADMDANLAALDANVAYMSDLTSIVDTIVGDFGLSGVVSGFQLTTSGTLCPGMTTGILYANGTRYAPAQAGNCPAPANATSYLYFQHENWPDSYYYRPVLQALNVGDAFLGIVVTNQSVVLSVTPATPIFGELLASPTAPGSLILPHLLGRCPVAANIRMTSAGAVWWQCPMDMDEVNLYLVASDAGVTAKVQVW